MMFYTLLLFLFRGFVLPVHAFSGQVCVIDTFCSFHATTIYITHQKFPDLRYSIIILLLQNAPTTPLHSISIINYSTTFFFFISVVAIGTGVCLPLRRSRPLGTVQCTRPRRNTPTEWYNDLADHISPFRLSN